MVSFVPNAEMQLNCGFLTNTDMTRKAELPADEYASNLVVKARLSAKFLL